MASNIDTCDLPMAKRRDAFLRFIIIRPYMRLQTLRNRDEFPTYTLHMWHAGGMQAGLQWRDRVGYCFRQNGKILFCAEDYLPSPCYELGSNESVRELLFWFTLKVGDTDSEYFAEYTQEQLAFCRRHADILRCEIEDRFGEEF